jgi:hypothetical protein
MSTTNNTTSPFTEDDLLDLIANQVAEGRVLDYKVIQPGNSDDDKKEFLADVSSFANTAGGHLIFGMEEDQGIALNLPGISGLDSDREKLRLENIIRDGIAPRIAGISIQSVQLQNGNLVIVIHIPKSWSSPHMVTFKGASRFFARNSAGKYQLDVQEIRQAVLLSESTAERIKNFRLDRLSQIIAGNTPIPVGDNAKLILHCVPLSAFQSGQMIDMSTAGKNYHNFFAEQRFSSRYNLDGILLFLNFRDGSPPPEYLQIFRQSHIEYVNGYIIGSNLLGSPNTNKIQIKDVELEVIKITKNILDYQRSLRIDPPIIISISLSHVKGYVFDSPSSLRVEAAYHNHGIDRYDLILPEVLIDKYPDSNDEMSQDLKPIFDAIWNAAGWPRSMNYNENGIWHPRQ